MVIIDYEELLGGEGFSSCSSSKQLQAALQEAYSKSHSLGVLAIRNVPGFCKAKQEFLPMAYSLIQLPNLETELVDTRSMYNAGWSHGKEKLKNNEPDLHKGSFYFNPVSDVPGTAELREKYPASYPCNLWPRNLAHFEERAKDLGRILTDTTLKLVPHLQALCEETRTTTENQEESDDDDDDWAEAMKDTDKVKARLLYYFPLDDTTGKDTAEDSWIGWHNDSGFLTALAGDLYVDHRTGKPVTQLQDDDEAGLYCLNRQGTLCRVQIPEDCMAVQVGECVQILTNGRVQATPHCVRGSKQAHVARISLPCFVDVPPTFPLRCSAPEEVWKVDEGTSRKIPPLAERWIENGMSFGDFLQRTFAKYYEWK